MKFISSVAFLNRPQAELKLALGCYYIEFLNHNKVRKIHRIYFKALLDFYESLAV